MFLTKIKLATKGGFAITVKNEGFTNTTTNEAPPQWVYEQFSQLENHIRALIAPQNCDLKSFEVRETKDNTRAHIEIYTQVGSTYATAKFEIDHFKITDLADSEHMSQETKDRYRTINQLIEQHRTFDTEMQLHFDQIINTPTSNQLELFDQ